MALTGCYGYSTVLIIILNKGHFGNVRIRKHLSVLLAVFLVLSMTGQAVFANSMPCRGTSACCCTTPTMDMTAAIPDDMDQNCCETTPAQTCDIGTTSPVSSKPFLAGWAHGVGDTEMAVASSARAFAITDTGLDRYRPGDTGTDHGGPPLYLQHASFLC